MRRLACVLVALATIYIYNHETKTETPCEDTIENCVHKVMMAEQAKEAAIEQGQQQSG